MCGLRRIIRRTHLGSYSSTPKIGESFVKAVEQDITLEEVRMNETVCTYTDLLTSGQNRLPHGFGLW
jgi:hypothetical protein